MVSRREVVRYSCLAGVGTLSGCADLLGESSDSNGDGSGDRTEQGTPGESSRLVWETASDWDDMPVQRGVAHESVDETSHKSEEAVQHGYTYTDPLAAESLAAYWPLDGTTRDFSGNGYHGTASEADPTDGILGRSAFSFTAPAAHVEVPRAVSEWDDSSAVTFSCWLAVNDFAGEDNRRIFENGDPNRDNAVVCNVAPTGDVRLGIKRTNTWHYWLTGSGPLEAGQFHHVAIAYDTEEGVAAFYVDGDLIRQQGTTNGAGYGFPRPPSPDENRVLIGHQSRFPGTVFGGRIAEVRAYDRRLDPSEIERFAAVGRRGRIRTATKTFDDPARPSLRLSQTGEEPLEVTVVGSPDGDATERNSDVVRDGSGIDASWSRSHTTFAVEVRMADDDPSTGARIDEIELVA